MKTETLAVTDFKARCLRLIDSVETEGLCIVVTKHGRPVAQVTPLPSAKRSLRAAYAGKVQVDSDIADLNFASEWELKHD